MIDGINAEELGKPGDQSQALQNMQGFERRVSETFQTLRQEFQFRLNEALGVPWPDDKLRRKYQKVVSTLMIALKAELQDTPDGNIVVTAHKRSRRK